jgi:hypothetical protein
MSASERDRMAAETASALRALQALDGLLQTADAAAVLRGFNDVLGALGKVRSVAATQTESVDVRLVEAVAAGGGGEGGIEGAIDAYVQGAVVHSAAVLREQRDKTAALRAIAAATAGDAME